MSKQQELLTALNVFKHAAIRLNRAWDGALDTVDARTAGIDDYPFEKSFAETMMGIMTWSETFKKELGELNNGQD